jgi:hypothetical protein
MEGTGFAREEKKEEKIQKENRKYIRNKKGNN